MSDIVKATEQHIGMLDRITKGGGGDRRTFLKLAGLTMAVFTVGGAISGCSDDTVTTPTGTGATLTNDDFGILNYAYALEQLEAAFYTQVVASMYTGASAEEKQIMTDIRDHEISHRDFFKAALGAKAIGSLEVNFAGIDFTNRTKVLEAARTFEDLGVSAYNGGGQYLTNVDYVLIAGKIVSVEARHASVIRDLINPKTSAFSDDTITPGGLDLARKPSEVLALAKPFIKTTITSQLP